MVLMDINPSVLQWALDDAARTAADLAEATGKSTERVSAWLSGDESPHLGDLRVAGRLLGRNPYFFALPEPPKQATYEAKFRSAIGSNVSRTERAVEVAAMRDAQRRQDLGRRLGAQRADVIDIDVSNGVAAAVTEAQDWLDWTPGSQMHATSKSRSFRILRAVIESRGIAVLLNSAGSEQFCGFSLPDPVLPLIYINSDYELPSVRSFTLLHELAHILVGSRRVCYGDDLGQEQFCNQFAARFLMPETHVRAYWEKQRHQFRDSLDFNPVRLVAKRYQTSWLAAAIRLDELGYAPSGLVQNLRNSRPEQKEKGFSNGDPWTRANRRFDANGATITRIVANATDEGRYSRLDAMRYFSVNESELRSTFALARGGDFPAGSSL